MDLQYERKMIMQNQPIINVGIIGHVANGKSSIVKILTGKSTQCYSKELERGITIKLGYANVKIWKNKNLDNPECYYSSDSSVNEFRCPKTNELCELVNHISLVDCPGHNMLTSTMLSGACVMDYTLLVESSTNPVIPAPQTWEHLVATKLSGIDNSIVCLNKIDQDKKKENIVKKVNDFRDFLKTFDVDKLVIPTSGVFNININVVCEFLSKLDVKEKNLEKGPKLLGIRSFDINKPQIIEENTKLKGGTLGGSLLEGKLYENDEVKIYPGYLKQYDDYEIIKDERVRIKKWSYCPLSAKVLSIYSEKQKLEYAVPGGLIGIQLDIDPSLLKDDRLAGNILIKKGESHNLKVTSKIEIELENIFIDYKTKEEKIINIQEKNRYKLNINAKESIGIVDSYDFENKRIKLTLDNAVVVELNETKVILGEQRSGDILAKCVIINIEECTLID